MMGANNNMTILAPELVSRSALAGLSKQPHLQVLSEPDAGIIRHTKHLFIAISATALSDIAEIIKKANDIKLLRALFVRENMPPEWLPQMLSRADLRMARNILMHTNEDWQTPRKIINAWLLGAPRDLIARANVTGESLLILNCALESFAVPFSKIPALSKMPKNQREKFRLSDSGSYIHWPVADVHLDIDAFRYAIDENWRKQCDLEKLTHNKNLGRLLALCAKGMD